MVVSFLTEFTVTIHVVLQHRHYACHSIARYYAYQIYRSKINKIQYQFGTQLSMEAMVTQLHHAKLPIIKY
ncbi:hypothetical protein PPL_04977 [Heterostelium album PN500]|uniref:Uncharacterized protein n=1 Tax=Heterostelium pallidum (strain ATCC 26659 / Pp 5 / PN500) TaxID=670386 RepID=D3B933_HETP5|nr:hypothetical protein PPL_04977 [Heterostelium album PN500]EFA82072.1 hypothetical protein PPL_04977 [Heterostelium album PN500]|eukprot:XP_020434189.1 hypothetical protein PPL_04977 [Heterostelium album PN500]